jgi:predicted lipoprotein with Yx(FWY)xxD motif
MWPSLQSQKEKAKMAKKQKCAKSWNPMHRLGRRQKLVVAAVIALLIIGAAVGIGVGVSKAVGGGVKSATGETKPIGDNGKTQ